MTNLNFAVDSMTRDIRTGFNYDCGGTYSVASSTGKNCNAGSDELFFTAADGTNVDYLLAPNGSIYKTTPLLSSVPITAPEVTISTTSPMFYVNGAASTDKKMAQPNVLIIIQGTAGLGTSQTSFNIQTFASQRVLNI